MIPDKDSAIGDKHENADTRLETKEYFVFHEF